MSNIHYHMPSYPHHRDITLLAKVAWFYIPLLNLDNRGSPL